MAADKLPEPELSDAEQERLLTIAEYLRDVIGAEAKAVLEFADSLAERYGDAGLVVFANMILRVCKEEVDASPQDFEEPSPGALRAAVNEEVWFQQQRKQKERAGKRLDIAVVCDYCDRLRRGNEWIKAKPPRGYEVKKDICPDCSANPDR
jgi:hypothetical protein